MAETRCADIVIIGAGVIGAAIAYTLARSAQRRIIVVERGAPGCEASNAAAGVLAVASSQARQGALLDLRRRSAAMFPALVAALEDETGMDTGYRRAGLIALAFADEDTEALRDLVHDRQKQGAQCELLTGSDVQALEPEVTSRIHAGAFFPHDYSIDSGRLVAALVAAAQRRGVEFRLGTAAQAISQANNVVKIQLDTGALEAGFAVVAAGAWSGELLASLGVKVPLRPARGEMAAVQRCGWELHHTVSAGVGYLVPRGGDVLIGSTTTFVGFDKRVTAEGVATLLANAAVMVPRLGAAVPVRTWAGLRPCPTIRRPIIASLPGFEHLLLATGHHRNGILLAPITAQLVAELITGTAPTVPLQPFSYRRH